jgi:protein tyrosine/serine phosphatase
MILPLPNTYWVLPGRLLAGEYPYGADESDTLERLQRLRAAGINFYIDLTQVGERPEYRHFLPNEAEHLRYAIPDTCVPDAVEQMQEIQLRIRDALALGRGVYVHCRAGIGRTGIVVGCYLAEEGRHGKMALRDLNRLWRQSARAKSWPKVPQTPEQADYIRRWPLHRISD